MLKTVTIEWSYPVHITTAINTLPVGEKGIYQITRKYRKKEYLVYIGKSVPNIRGRLQSHNNNWLDQYKGEKYVRIGHFKSKITDSDLFVIESAIIYHLKTEHNTHNTQSYTYEHEYKISSIGFRGFVPNLIETIHH